MISERDMVMDALSTIKHDIISLTMAAQEASNLNARQAILQFRNQAEQVQQQLAQLATQRGYYIPAPPADASEIQQVKNQLQNAAVTDRPLVTV